MEDQDQLAAPDQDQPDAQDQDATAAVHVILPSTSTLKSVSNNPAPSTHLNASSPISTALKHALLQLSPQAWRNARSKPALSMCPVLFTHQQSTLQQSWCLLLKSVWFVLLLPLLFLHVSSTPQSPHLHQSTHLTHQSSLQTSSQDISLSPSNMPAERTSTSNHANSMLSGTTSSWQQSSLVTTASITTTWLSRLMEERTNFSLKELDNPTALESLLTTSNLSENILIPTLSSTVNSRALMSDSPGESSTTFQAGKVLESKLDGERSIMATGTPRSSNLTVTRTTSSPRSGHLIPSSSSSSKSHAIPTTSTENPSLSSWNSTMPPERTVSQALPLPLPMFSGTMLSLEPLLLKTI